MGHEDDDRHVGEAASHKIIQVHALIQEDVSDGHQWNVSVISPEERQSDQPTWVPIDKGWRRRKNIAQYLRTGTERGEWS